MSFFYLFHYITNETFLIFLRLYYNNNWYFVGFICLFVGILYICLDKPKNANNLIMLNLKRLASILFFLFGINAAFSQLGFSHEVGIIAGPLEFRSDFGARNDAGVNFGNSGVGIGIVHYINFAYRADCNCYTTDTYFNDHFKLRNEISWNKTNLENLGEFVDASQTSVDADRLRGHTGVAQNLDIGTQIEWFPLSIRSFQGFGYSVAPYASLGVHYTLFNPEVSTTFGDGDITNPDNFFTRWVQAQPVGDELGFLRNTSGGTFSLVTSIGARYKLNKLSDLLVDFRWQVYFRDDIDGLDHRAESNQFNDWLVWLNFGYIYYLD